MNYGFWVRVGLAGAATAYVLSVQVQSWPDVPGLSMMQTFTYCLGVGAGFICTGIAAAEIWVFPVPFLMLSLSTVTTGVLLGLFRIMIGGKSLKQILEQREQLRRLNRIGSLQGFMTMIYPAYQVLFVKANGTNFELPVLLLLPVFKHIMKRVFSSAAAHKEDMIPGQVVLTVDFFIALYLATFVQSLSPTTLVVVMLVDIAETAIELRELHLPTIRILQRIHNIVGAATKNKSSGDLLAAARSLCHDPEVQQNLMQGNIQVRSCIRHRLSSECAALLEHLERHPHVAASDSVRQPKMVFVSGTSASV
ncbi:unnamed protein product [Phytophthora lilii]|uniref:Unnamed protein product n=1 Tax=Phytophthora lilii TaxID=2077276 RepID=A0A9W6TG97_9STRA|nr:unnamed protein product [Phytophthora lilii]